MDAISTIIGLPLFLAFLFYLSRAIGYGSAQASREKRYVLTTSFAIALLIFVICGAAIGKKSYGANSEIPLALLPLVFLIPASLIIFGLAQVFYADAASALFERRREMGGISRWIIPSVPKRESFILRGWIVAGTGTFIFVILLFGIYIDSSNGYLH